MNRVLQLVGSAVLLNCCAALATLIPGSIPYLTRETNHTLYMLCERLHNPSLTFEDAVGIPLVYRPRWAMTNLDK